MDNFYTFAARVCVSWLYIRYFFLDRIRMQWRLTAGLQDAVRGHAIKAVVFKNWTSVREAIVSFCSVYKLRITFCFIFLKRKFSSRDLKFIYFLQIFFIGKLVSHETDSALQQTVPNSIKCMNFPWNRRYSKRAWQREMSSMQSLHQLSEKACFQRKEISK